MDNYVAVNSDPLHEFQFNFFVFAMKVHEKTKAHQWRVFVMDTNMTKTTPIRSSVLFFFFTCKVMQSFCGNYPKVKN